MLWGSFCFVLFYLIFQGISAQDGYGSSDIRALSFNSWPLWLDLTMC